jgi:hypothetical protein
MPLLSSRKGQNFLAAYTGGAHAPLAGHELAEDRKASHELLNILDILYWTHIAMAKILSWFS